jgi:hypothetical protein
MIFSHLKRHGSINPMQALREYRVMRLAARVQDLREAGHRIETRMVDRRGKRFAEYTYYAKA